MPDEQPPAFGFTGSWPFSGEITAGGHPVGTVTSWSVTAPADGLPQVTLLAPGALALALSSAEVAVDDRTRDALLALGWKPPGS